MTFAMGEQRYGEEVRPWPERGYFFDYSKHVFARWFDQVDNLHLLVGPGGDVGEVWDWSFGAFSWTPDGDIWETYTYGTNATRARAETECRTAAYNAAVRLRGYMADVDAKIAARRASE